MESCKPSMSCAIANRGAHSPGRGTPQTPPARWGRPGWLPARGRPARSATGTTRPPAHRKPDCNQNKRAQRNGTAPASSRGKHFPKACKITRVEHARGLASFGMGLNPSDFVVCPCPLEHKGLPQLLACNIGLARTGMQLLGSLHLVQRQAYHCRMDTLRNHRHLGFVGFMGNPNHWHRQACTRNRPTLHNGRGVCTAINRSPENKTLASPAAHHGVMQQVLHTIGRRVNQHPELHGGQRKCLLPLAPIIPASNAEFGACLINVWLQTWKSCC